MWTNFQSKEEEVYRVTGQYEESENKLKQIAKENSKESGWFQESMQSRRGDSAL